jgi:hypothetical protein
VASTSATVNRGPWWAWMPGAYLARGCQLDIRTETERLHGTTHHCGRQIDLRLRNIGPTPALKALAQVHDDPGSGEKCVALSSMKDSCCINSCPMPGALISWHADRNSGTDRFSEIYSVSFCVPRQHRHPMGWGRNSIYVAALVGYFVSS